MKFSDLKRKPKKIKENLIENKDGSVNVKKDMSVYLMKSLEDKILLDITIDKWRVLGNFMMVVGDNYALLGVCGLVNLVPTASSIVEIEGIQYYRLDYSAKAKFIIDLNIVKVGEVAYEVINKYLFYGSTPGYLDRDDLSRIYDTSSEFCGVGIDNRPELLEVIISQVVRSKGKLDVELRHAQKGSKFVTLALSNVLFGKATVFNKISGSYQKVGLPSALDTDLKILSPLEESVRS